MKMLPFYSFLPFLFLIHLHWAFSSTKPGCGTGCGNLEIPYPFGLGLGSNCSINPWFDILCNTSTNPPKPYLSTTNFEIAEISGAQIRVKYPAVSLTCYNTSMDVDGPITPPINTPLLFYFLDWQRFSINLSATPYTFSDANQLMAFGCDDLATVAAQGSAMVEDGYGGGCVAYCSESNGSSSYGYCPGNGCCKAQIPKGTSVLSVSLSDSHRNWRARKLFSCNFAFIAEKGKGSQPDYVYNKSDLFNSATFLKNNPMLASRPLVLDWRIGSQNCSTVTQDPTANYACQKNSFCVDSDTGGGGYLCRCLEGFEGNPYLPPGCLDIDDCKSNPCHPRALCTNTPGSFYCSCPEGYYGDGKANGIGCLPVPVSHSLPTVAKVSVGLGSGIGFLLLLSFLFQLRKVLQKRKEKRRKQKFFRRNGGFLLHQQISSTNEGTLGQTKHFSSKELEKATDQFNESRILGQGGQGIVYKGMLSDGKIVAIKKSKLVDENQLEQFINEVVILSQINHRNVVKLLGCCLETEVPLLIYEFVPNGTLFDLIHDENNEFIPITWNMRVKIAADIASALAYLHSATSFPIYHRDIKSSNILLDEKYVAKVSDFGTSKTIAVGQTHVTTLVKGTFGYLDPEYFQSNQFTEKSDVYSFGVVLVELLTGQRPISATGLERSLATRFLQSMEENHLDAIIDPRVSQRGVIIKKEVIAVARLAQMCLNLNGKKRPTMKEVAMELENVVRMSRMPSSGEVPRLGLIQTLL